MDPNDSARTARFRLPFSYWPWILNACIVAGTVVMAQMSIQVREHATWLVLCMLIIGVGFSIENARRLEWSKRAVKGAAISVSVALFISFASLLHLMNDSL